MAETRKQQRERIVGHVLGHPQTVAERQRAEREIVARVGQFLGECGEIRFLVDVIEPAPQQRGKQLERTVRVGRPVRHQRTERLQRVEEKVRIESRAQRVQLGAKSQRLAPLEHRCLLPLPLSRQANVHHRDEHAVNDDAHYELPHESIAQEVGDRGARGEERDLRDDRGAPRPEKAAAASA